MSDMSESPPTMTETPLHLLLVDDEAAFREVIAERLAEHGFIVEQAGTGEEALARLNEFAFDMLVTDLRLPGVDGRQVLDEAFARYPESSPSSSPATRTVREAVEVTRLGAEGFITKPFQFEELMHELNVADRTAAAAGGERLPARAAARSVSRSTASSASTPIMMQLFELLRTVAATSSTVLITGETGTGKELAARAIHDASPRAQPAVRRDQLQRDSGDAARSRAVRPRARRVHRRRRESQGRLEQANRGTLFLDEVGTMSAGAAGEAPARAAGARVRARRRFADDQGGRARDRGDELRLEEDGRGRHVPRGLCTTG